MDGYRPEPQDDPKQRNNLNSFNAPISFNQNLICFNRSGEVTAVVRLYLRSDATANATAALETLKSELSDGSLGQMSVTNGSYNASYISKYNG